MYSKAVYVFQNLPAERLEYHVEYTNPKMLLDAIGS